MWKKNQLLQRIEEEIEVLGFSVSPHPSSKYDPLVKSGWITPIQTVFEEGYMRFVGMIVDIRKISTRKGEQMAYVTLQDASGMMMLSCFRLRWPKSINTFNKTRWFLRKVV